LQKAGTPPVRLPHQWAGGTQSLSFAPGGKKLALINVGKHVTIWDKETEKLSRIDTGDWRTMRCVSFSSNGGLLATADGLIAPPGDNDRHLLWRVSVWDMPSGGLKYTFENQRNRIEDTAISPDGTHLAIASEDGVLRIWSITRGVKVFETARHEFAMCSVAFAPDGKTVAGAFDDGKIRIWTVPQGVEAKGEVVARLSGYCVLFVDNSTVLVSGGKNGLMSIWDLRQNREICRLTGHDKYVSSVSFARRKKRLVSGDWNGTVLVWDIGDAIKPDK
jgi:WD40 repeat protein